MLYIGHEVTQDRPVQSFRLFFLQGQLHLTQIVRDAQVHEESLSPSWKFLESIHKKAQRFAGHMNYKVARAWANMPLFRGPPSMENFYYCCIWPAGLHCTGVT